MASQGLSLTQAAKKHGTTAGTVLKYMGPDQIERSGRRWMPTAAFRERQGLIDRPERVNIVTGDGLVEVTVSDAHTLSDLGRYSNYVKGTLRGDEDARRELAKFEGKTFTDANGITRLYITDRKLLSQLYDDGRISMEEFYAEARDSFAVRASRRRYENHGKACPRCGQSDPLLLTGNGLCEKCASDHQEEQHHLLPHAFRTKKEDEEFTIPLSLYAHRLVSESQGRSPHTGEKVDPASQSFLEGQLREHTISAAELALVLTYLHEQPDLVDTLPWLMLIPLGLLFLLDLDRIDWRTLLAHAEENLLSSAKQHRLT